MMSNLPDPSVQGPNAPDKFDAYVDRYSALHQQNIKASGESIEYFARYKLRCLKRLGVAGPVLDFGCGIGNLTHLLVDSFSQVVGYDPSSESLKTAAGRVPQAKFVEQLDELPQDHFGVAVLAGVLHHIPLKERDSVLNNVFQKLKPGGRVVIFEHNPLNPLTRKAVNECEFDDDAILLWGDEIKERLLASGFRDVALDYIVFFPRLLAVLRPLEPHLRRLMLGAQTMTVGTK